MAKTHQVLTAPAPGTVVPVREYDDDQKAKLHALQEVRASQSVARGALFGLKENPANAAPSTH